MLAYSHASMRSHGAALETFAVWSLGLHVLANLLACLQCMFLTQVLLYTYIAGFGVVYTSACALVMSTHHEVLDVSSTTHSFALILLWCEVGTVGIPLSVRRSRLV